MNSLLRDFSWRTVFNEFVAFLNKWANQMFKCESMYVIFVVNLHSNSNTNKKHENKKYFSDNLFISGKYNALFFAGT